MPWSWRATRHDEGPTSALIAPWVCKQGTGTPSGDLFLREAAGWMLTCPPLILERDGACRVRVPVSMEAHSHTFATPGAQQAAKPGFGHALCRCENAPAVTPPRAL